MDLNSVYKFKAADVMAYSPTSSFELCGREIKLKFDSGRHTTLTLTRSIDGGELCVSLSDGLSEVPALCQKISDGLFLVCFAVEQFGAAYILDTAAGLATHVVIGGDAPIEDFGCIDSASTSMRHAHSRDLEGNTVDWTFSPHTVARVRYAEGSAEVTIADAPPFEVTDCRAIRLVEGIYFLYGQGGKQGVLLAMDFTTMLFNGAILSVPQLPQLAAVGGWGRVV